MYHARDRPVPQTEIVEYVMMTHAKPLFGPLEAALEEVRKQSVLQYFLENHSLTNEEKLRPTTKYGFLCLTTGHLDPETSVSYTAPGSFHWNRGSKHHPCATSTPTTTGGHTGR
jgi:hypothetical protein